MGFFELCWQSVMIFALASCDLTVDANVLFVSFHDMSAVSAPLSQRSKVLWFECDGCLPSLLRVDPFWYCWSEARVHHVLDLLLEVPATPDR